MVWVYLSADFTANRDRHHSHLEVLTGPQGVAECVVSLGSFFDVQNEWVWSVIVFQYVAHAIQLKPDLKSLPARLDYPIVKNRLLALLLALIAVVVVIVFEPPALGQLRQWADATGSWFGVLFWLGYVLITQFPVPRTIMTLSAGILFGPVQGILISLTATTVSAALSLSVVRGLFRDWIRLKLTHPTVTVINNHLRERGWRAILSLRMIAAVPFSILNYVAALTEVRLIPFTIATFIGSAPGTVATVFFGDTLTGQASPAIVVITVILAVIGILGLAWDMHTSVKSRG